MSSAIINFAAKRALAGYKEKKATSDPYFEEVRVYDKHGREKIKKQKKGIPPGVSDHDGAIMKKVRKRAWRLDMCLFNCCGLRFGWSSVIGIIPLVGDIIDALCAVLLVRSCTKIEGGLPKTIQSRMMLNIIVDFTVGLVPIVGDIADAAYKANSRNSLLLEEYLVRKVEEERKAAGGSSSNRTPGAPSRPQPTLPPPSSSKGGFFSGKSRQPDEEMAMSNLSKGGRSSQSGNGHSKAQNSGRPSNSRPNAARNGRG